MSHTNKKYIKRLMTPEEQWKDVLDDGLAAKAAIDAVADIERELEKEEGYIVWDMDNDKYLFMDDDTIGWDADYYSLINEEDMEMLQEILYKDSILPLKVSGMQLDLYHAVVNVAHLQVVPCVEYEGEEPQFDFVNAFRFDRAEQ